MGDLATRVSELKRVLLVLSAIATMAAALLAIQSAPVYAQGPSPEAKQLYTQLYCPLCGGVRLDACQLPVCDQMRTEIVQKLEAGQGKDEIIQYYRARWGDQVLGYPPAEGINLFPWLVPIALVLGGGVILWRMARGWTRTRSQVAAVSAPSASVPADLVARVDRELYE